MADKIIFETPRLLLRQLTVEDATFIIDLLNTPGWLQYIGDRNVRTLEAAVHYLENGPIKSYQVNGYGLWLVIDKASHANVGMCGLLKREALHASDIGFAFMPEFHGRGLAQEAIRDTIQFAFEKLMLPEILAITQQDNFKTAHLLQKAGMVYQKLMTLPGETTELMLFSLKAERYKELK